MRRLALFLTVSLVAAQLVSGCGGGGDAAVPAAVVPLDVPAFAEFTLQPDGKTKSVLERIAKTIGAVSFPEEEIIFQLEKAALNEGTEIAVEEQILPWLGKKGGLFFSRFDGGRPRGLGVVLETSDEAAAGKFVEAGLSGGAAIEGGSYEGTDFRVLVESGFTVGMIEGLVALAEDEATFESMVDAARAGGLAGGEEHAARLGAPTPGSVLNAFVNVGRLVHESGAIAPDVIEKLTSLGFETDGATASVSVVPRADAVIVDVTTDLFGGRPVASDKTHLLASLPDQSILSIALPDFGARLERAAARFGGPAANLEGVDGEIDRGALYVEGVNRRELRGGLILIAKDVDQARALASRTARFMRSLDLPFPDRPIVAVVRGRRIAVGFGSKATQAALTGSEGMLRRQVGPIAYPVRHYYYALEAAHGEPITAFLDGWQSLKLANTLVPRRFDDYYDAETYLGELNSIAAIAEPRGDLTRLRLIINY